MSDAEDKKWSLLTEDICPGKQLQSSLHVMSDTRLHPAVLAVLRQPHHRQTTCNEGGMRRGPLQWRTRQTSGAGDCYCLTQTLRQTFCLQEFEGRLSVSSSLFKAVLMQLLQ